MMYNNIIKITKLVNTYIKDVNMHLISIKVDLVS
jgi:hypothetical protein